MIPERPAEPETAESWLTTHYGYLRRIVRSQNRVPDDDTDDVVQTACLHIWQKWDTWRNRGRDHDAWAARIAENAAKDWWRYQHAGTRDVRQTHSLDRPLFTTHLMDGDREIDRLKREGANAFVDPAMGVEDLILLRARLNLVWAMLTQLERELTVEMASGYTMVEQAQARGTTMQAIKAKAYRLHRKMRAVDWETA